MLKTHSIFSKKLLGTLAVGAGLALAPMGASAVTITAADLPSGLNAVDLGFATVTANPGTFTHKTEAGYDIAGVAGGYENGEIDLADESMVIHFTDATYVTSLDLGLLFAAGEQDDILNEVASVLVYIGQDVFEYTLSVVDGTNAIWSGPGAVTNISPAIFGGAAVWSITNPFGDTAVNAIRLQGSGPPTPTDYRNNDYGLVSLNGRPVPEPGTVMLMSMGLAGLGVAGRKRLA